MRIPTAVEYVAAARALGAEDVTYYGDGSPCRATFTFQGQKHQIAGGDYHWVGQLMVRAVMRLLRQALQEGTANYDIADRNQNPQEKSVHE